MQEDISKKPLVEIFNEMSFLEQEIGLKQLKYEKEMEKMILYYERLRLEVLRRYPILKDKEEFKPKVFKKGQVE